jgi:transmembrane sensor
MNPFRRPSVSAASDWFAWVRSGGMDASADKRWSEWMTADPRHETAYEQRELAWGLTADLHDRPAIGSLLNELDQLLSAPRGLPMRKRTVARRRSWPMALAASLAVIAITTVVLVRRSADVSEYSTALGEQRVVTLADQSTVSLNTATTLRVSYSRAARRVDLLNGEAVFAVTKDSGRPFEVHALHAVTAAVGTQFDVQIAASSATVSVLEGAVSVAREKSGGGIARASAGQAVDYALDGAVSAPRAAHLDRIRGWQAGRIVFNDITLTAALEEYNRYGGVPITLGNSKLGERRINGVFRIGDQQAFLGALQQGLHVKASRTASRIVLGSE